MLIEGVKQGTLGTIVPFTVSDSGSVATSGTIVQNIPDYENASDLLAAYGNFSDVNWAGGDFVTNVQTSNGQSVTAICMSPLKSR